MDIDSMQVQVAMESRFHLDLLFNGRILPVAPGCFALRSKHPGGVIELSNCRVAESPRKEKVFPWRLAE